MQINPAVFRQLREKKVMSQTELAEKSKVSTRTIQRIEMGQQRKCRNHQLMKLAGALGVKPEKLGDQEPGETSREQELKSFGFSRLKDFVRSDFNFRVEMIERTYGVMRRDVIELAPLLFVLIAERSLSERRKAAQEAQQKLEELNPPFGHPQLEFLNRTSEFTDALLDEERSIEAKDILAEEISEFAQEYGTRDGDCNPFAETILRLVAECDPKIVEPNKDLMEDCPWPLGVEVSLFTKDLSELSGDDSLAIDALIGPQGARIRDIPKDLLQTDRRDDRIKWLVEKLPPARRMELLEERDRLSKAIEGLNLEQILGSIKGEAE
ncbi:MAG: hypothetical protein RL186_141 [Pseudomonadota bacterium]|jgi:transcriptional regulator with XRE-family HTH domain